MCGIVATISRKPTGKLKLHPSTNRRGPDDGTVFQVHSNVSFAFARLRMNGGVVSGSQPRRGQWLTTVLTSKHGHHGER